MRRLLFPGLLMVAGVLAACGPGRGEGPVPSVGELRQSVLEGAPSPAPVAVTLTNPGTCPLDWRAVVTTSDGAAWLAVSPAQGVVAVGGTAALSVSFATGALLPGLYTGSVWLDATCVTTGRPALGAPTAIAVTLTVREGQGFLVGGVVTGLVGQGLTLRKNGRRALAIDADGPFSFPAADGEAWTISIQQQPRDPAQACTVQGGSGTVQGADVTSVIVACPLPRKVGGTIYGLSGAGLTLSDGFETLSPSAAGAFQFAHEYLDGQSYAVTLTAQPQGPAQTCTVKNASGVVAGADVKDVVVSCPVGAGPLYGGTLRWNDYVRRDSSSVFTLSGTPCDGTEVGPPSVCVHAGEMVAMPVAGRASCAGVTVSDALGALQWRCVPGSPWVRVVSTGLAEDKGLVDLVDPSTRTWRLNTVTVREGATELLSSVPARWHANPVLSAPVGNNQSLGMAGAVYVVPVNQTGSFVLGAPRVALVVARGAQVTLGSAMAGTVSFNAQPFGWVEGTIVSGATSIGLNITGARQAVARGVRLQRGALLLTGATGARVTDTFLTHLSDCVQVDAASRWNQFERLTLFNCGISGLRSYGSDLVVAGLLTASSRIGVFVNGSATVPAASSLIMQATFALDSSYGAWAQYAPDTTFLSLAAVNTRIGVAFSNAGTTGRLHHAAVTHTLLNDTPTYNFGLVDSGATSTGWSGVLKLGFNAQDCRLGAVAVACNTFVDPGAALTTGASLLGAFVGSVADDAANTSDTAGTVTYGAGLDLTHFDNPYRGWGREGTFPLAALEDDCVTGTCRVWDWSAKASDTVARGVLPLPSGAGATTLLHRWAVSGAGECGQVPGATWTGTTCQSELLTNAVEVTGDGVGNDNLLCEAGERCLHTPNLGAYQGHGALVPAGQGGVAGDVEVVRYETNGR